MLLAIIAGGVAASLDAAAAQSQGQAVTISGTLGADDLQGDGHGLTAL